MAVAVKRFVPIAGLIIAASGEASNVSARVTGGDICQSQHNLHCSGQDIKRIDNVGDHYTCCNACKSTSGCKAWSWGWNYPGKWCTLKSGCDHPTTDPHVHSGGGGAPSPPPPPTPPTPGGLHSITIFHWNVHYQCAQPHAGGSEACRQAAVGRFGYLVGQAGAQIAVGIEMSGAHQALSGWSASGEYEDAVSVMVAPGWRVLKRGGGQIPSGGGARGVAVMLVVPPHPVAGCSQLCVLGVHPGHSRVHGGKSIVDGVCGRVADTCAIASGDWNMDASVVRSSSWPTLIGGTPTVVAPNQGTCCYRACSGCKFDHGGTNIRGATDGGTRVWPYQLTDKFGMKEEHMPTSLRINFPSSAMAPNESSPAYYV